MYPRYILSDNGTKFKNQLIDKVLQQLGIECIFSAPYHPQSNGKLEVFHKYLKPTLKKLCEKGPIKLGQVYKSSSSQQQSDTKHCHSGNTILLGLWKRPQLTSTPTSRTYAKIPRRQRVWIAQLGSTSSSPSNC